MAQLIRNTHELATIRVQLRPARSGLELSFASFLGPRLLAEVPDVPADLLGIHPELSVSAYRGAHFQVPEHVMRPVVGSLAAEVEPGAPCWLQVGSSSGHLAVVPWERHFQPALDRPLLRVPNFLTDPIFLTGRLRAALVVSSPRAKTPFSVEQYTRNLVSLARDAVPQGTELHVFADLEAFDSLRHLSAPAGHVVVVHDPRGGDAQGGTEIEARGMEGQLASPWLKWRRAELAGEALDLVHFVCPGFFRGDRGALALARSPGQNEDSQWSHFIGTDEVIAFLDLVGAWSVGFSPPYENVWAIGLRLLADRLAWQRPGPLFIHDSQNGSPDDLAGVYRFLFALGEQEPPTTPNLSLYSHPRRMQRYRQVTMDSFASVTASGLDASARETFPEQLVMLAQKGDHRSQASMPRIQSAWVQANGLKIDRMLLDIGHQDTPGRRGSLDALARVRRVFESVREADGTTASDRSADRRKVQREGHAGPDGEAGA